MYTTGEIQEKSKEFEMSDDTILPTKTFNFYQKSEKKKKSLEPDPCYANEDIGTCPTNYFLLSDSSVHTSEK